MEQLQFTVPLNGNPEAAFYAGVLALSTELGLELEKAVKPHPAHIKPRSATGKFLPANQVPEHGPRLSAAEAQAAVTRAGQLVTDELRPRLFQHLGDWEGGKINPAEWYRRSAQDLRYFYGELYRCGKQAAGNPGLLLTPQDKALLNRVVTDELHYLVGFRDHMLTGGGVMPYPQRLELYVGASWEAYWLGWILGDKRPKRQISWVYGATEVHCGFHAGGKAQGCSDFVALGWLPVADFVSQVVAQGFAPRCGLLECGGWHCLCYLTERLLGEPEWPQAAPYPQPAMAPPAPVAESTPEPIPVPVAAAMPTTGELTASRAVPAVLAPAVAPVATSTEPASKPNYKQEADPTEGVHLMEALAALSFLGAVGERRQILRDAVSYLYLNAQEALAWADNPERAKVLRAERERLADWLAARFQLPLAAAEVVAREAVQYPAYREQGRQAVWVSGQWQEPQLVAYPDLRQLYLALEA